MSNQVYASPGVPYWAPASLEDDVDQLELTVAFTSLNEPVANSITTWQDPGVGTYPLTDNRGATNASDAKADNTGNLYDVNSMSLTPVAANPGTDNTIWINSSDSNKLYHGAVDLENTGDVVGPASSTDAGIASYDGTTGKLLKSLPITLQYPATGSVYISGNSTSSMSTYNTCIGYASSGVLTGQNNTFVGGQCANNTGNCSDNICIGFQAGSLLSGNSNNNNIYINNAGSTESDHIRIGTSQTSCHIKGIHGVTPAGATQTVIIDANGEMGSVAMSMGMSIGEIFSEGLTGATVHTVTVQ